MLDRPVAPSLGREGSHLQTDPWFGFLKAFLEKEPSGGGALFSGYGIGKAQSRVGQAERTGQRELHRHRVIALERRRLDTAQE